MPRGKNFNRDFGHRAGKGAGTVGSKSKRTPAGSRRGVLGPETPATGPGAAFNDGKKADGTPDGLVGLLQKAGPVGEAIRRIIAGIEDD